MLSKWTNPCVAKPKGNIPMPVLFSKALINAKILFDSKQIWACLKFSSPITFF